MAFWGILFFYGLIVVLVAIGTYIQWYGDDAFVRPPLLSMWPSKEGFMNLSQWLPDANALTVKQDCDSSAVQTGPVRSYMLLEGDLEALPEPRVALGPTSEQCYKVDYSRTLELSSYAQRTNNYKHKNPENCSAPNHDLVLDFYRVN